MQYPRPDFDLVHQIALLLRSFPSVTSLSASYNELSQLSPQSLPDTLTQLTLEGNLFEELRALAPLASLPSLQSLHLRDNLVKTVDAATEATALRFPATLTYLDISYNAVDSWDLIDQLEDVFPGLTGLRIAHNPLFDGDAGSGGMGIEEGYMLTVARLGRLESLNFTAVRLLSTTA